MRRSIAAEVAVSLDDVDGLLIVYTYTPELGWDDGELGLTDDAPEHWRHLAIVEWLESAYRAELRNAIEAQCRYGVANQATPVSVHTQDLCARKFHKMKAEVPRGA